MERYTASAIERVSVAFDSDDADVDRDEQSDEYEPCATIEIEHESEVIDHIDVGPDGAMVLHDIIETPEFELDLTERTTAAPEP